MRSIYARNCLIPGINLQKGIKMNNTPNWKTVIFVTIMILSVFSAVFAESAIPEDGVYSAVFKTDSSMFKINEAYEGRGTLTIANGEMSIHVTLPSKNILNLFYGLAEDAKKEGAELLIPTEDDVTYSDGFQDVVYGFDIPVPYLDEEFDVALIGKKGKWYDHKVSVTDLIRIGDLPVIPEDGDYTCEVTLKGGSGRASVQSPAALTVKDGIVTAEIIWSSPYYEYMLVDEIQYDPVNEEGNSTFEIPVVLDTEIAVSALTMAMSQPHLIDYTLYFDSTTLAGE